VLIATGSKPTVLSGLETDGQYIIDSRQALQMEELPKSILIVGGGVIGLEWASMLAGFGVQVTVVEAAQQILPSMDQSLAQEAKKQLEASNITFLTDSTVLPETIKKDENLTVDIEQKESGRQTLQVEKMMIAIGREGNTSNLGLENTAISTKD